LYNSKSDFSPEEIVKKNHLKKKKGKKTLQVSKGKYFYKKII